MQTIPDLLKYNPLKSENFFMKNEKKDVFLQNPINLVQYDQRD